MDSVIEITGVTKTFGPKVAVRDFSLSVERGAIYGFIGPNGAGKTTTIRMIMSIYFPDSGSIRVLGRSDALRAKDRIGYLPEERGVYKKMRVGAFLEYMGRLKGLDPGPALTAKVRHWLERVGLIDCLRKRCEELSKGMQQKVQFVSSVIHEPELLILDEPFSGLDPVNMILLRNLFVEQHKRGCSLIFSTHVMHQAEQLCDHIVMIHNGAKVLDEPTPTVLSRTERREVEFEPVSAPMDWPSVAGVRSFARTKESTHVARLTDDADPSRVIAALAQAVPVRRIELKRGTLEDVFVSIVGEPVQSSNDWADSGLQSAGVER